MQILEGHTIFSASDLVGFAACEHLTQLELAAARGEITRPSRHDPLLEVLVRRGEEHESELLAAHPGFRGAVHIEATGRTLADLELAAAATACAMRDGAPLIYQATFFHDGWMGLADFVERVD